MEIGKMNVIERKKRTEWNQTQKRMNEIGMLRNESVWQDEAKWDGWMDGWMDWMDWMDWMG